MRAALEAQDAGGVREAAHALKGSASNMGALTLSRTAHALQQLAETGVLDGAFSILGDLERELERVRAGLLAAVPGKVRTA